jgi:hypothetical protein
MKIMWYALNVVNNYGEKKGQLRVSKASPNKREFGDDDYECFNGIKIGTKSGSRKNFFKKIYEILQIIF